MGTDQNQRGLKQSWYDRIGKRHRERDLPASVCAMALSIGIDMALGTETMISPLLSVRMVIGGGIRTVRYTESVGLPGLSSEQPDNSLAAWPSNRWMRRAGSVEQRIAVRSNRISWRDLKRGSRLGREKI